MIDDVKSPALEGQVECLVGLDSATLTQRLALELAKASNATRDMVYLPVDCIGRILWLGMQAERDIEKLESRLRRV